MKLLLVIALLYFFLSFITYIVYALDKSAAQKQQRRISERTLHGLSLVGGWPGAMLAQKQLRHKTQKQPFRFIFWMTVFLNLAAVGIVCYRFA